MGYKTGDWLLQEGVPNDEPVGISTAGLSKPAGTCLTVVTGPWKTQGMAGNSNFQHGQEAGRVVTMVPPLFWIKKLSSQSVLSTRCSPFSEKPR
ncbi:hypothetical protein Cob_v005571 [Colletotrichum orbiculare MAFF 240422]|uniref:Uncharacterized protein n=1 Tax=Colletotrichum orbiculare (strain 104-T / ATCC 96160 / CBS 514.97 / LARS 414 / MAFF 240422) TaxID=1213857 RepID=A0A484FWM9_COLOR|nr:hypothetical protein Cob_v005571 [Colletotrichum orbiculare MAFF 240422]